MSDVVVVGGGAAGCVVAARLAETGRSVVLLEAGPDRRADIPATLRDGWSIDRETLDWGFIAEPDSSHEARHVWRKRLLGGTGWLTRFTPRGHPADYDAWGEGWSWDEVLPCFRRLEHDLEFGHEPWHGDAGPLPSTRYPDRDYAAVTQQTLDAVVAHGHPWVEDVNRPGAVGAGRMPMNTLDGRRVTTADAYLSKAPSGLEIRTDATVDRVEFAGDRATGVRLDDGSVVEGGAVVLCAGTYGSPVILLRSGLAVPGLGENLADHPGIYLDLGYQGPATSPVLHSITSFRSADAAPEAPPDLLFWIADPDGDPAEFGIEILLMKPRSRGSVQLRSTDPNDPPVIRLPNLEHTSDVRRLMGAYRHGLEVAGLPPIPDDAALEVKIRAEAYSIPHVVGTCALGSVVDGGAAVHGCKRLWVVDASIIPDAPSGFVHFPTVMLAERLSERIASLL